MNETSQAPSQHVCILISGSLVLRRLAEMDVVSWRPFAVNWDQPRGSFIKKTSPFPSEPIVKTFTT